MKKSVYIIYLYIYNYILYSFYTDVLHLASKSEGSIAYEEVEKTHLVDQIIQAPHPLQSPHVNSNAWGMHPFLLLLHMQNQNHPPILQNKPPTCSYPHITALNGNHLI